MIDSQVNENGKRELIISSKTGISIGLLLLILGAVISFVVSSTITNAKVDTITDELSKINLYLVPKGELEVRFENIEKRLDRMETKIDRLSEK